MASFRVLVHESGLYAPHGKARRNSMQFLRFPVFPAAAGSDGYFVVQDRREAPGPEHERRTGIGHRRRQAGA